MTPQFPYGKSFVVGPSGLGGKRVEELHSAKPIKTRHLWCMQSTAVCTSVSGGIIDYSAACVRTYPFAPSCCGCRIYEKTVVTHVRYTLRFQLSEFFMISFSKK